jgi:hypothetical protein
MKRFVIAVMVIVVAFSYSCKKKEKPAPPAPAPPKIETPKPKAKPVVKPKPVVKDEGVNLDDKYFVIVNSYTIPEIAREKSKEWGKKGFKPHVIMRNMDGYYRLAIKSFNDYSDAMAAALKLRKEYPEFKDAWVMNRSDKIEDEE